jgi:hypothetical protein
MRLVYLESEYKSERENDAHMGLETTCVFDNVSELDTEPNMSCLSRESEYETGQE